MSDKLYKDLLLAKQGDETAIENVLSRFEPKIKKLSSTLPSSERADLEQELRIQLVRSVDKFNIEKLVSFWSYYENNG
ncbi:helix-turn-helix domain-containing protein [Halobacillus seohaensis]|uniref:Helix-turn-helix domain-containing protein n=1 Tax=Halobacillus seohaensis TaxID=447421 RepID=A0ABW2ELF3_9BACI